MAEKAQLLEQKAQLMEMFRLGINTLEETKAAIAKLDAPTTMSPRRNANTPHTPHRTPRRNPRTPHTRRSPSPVVNQSPSTWDIENSQVSLPDDSEDL
jgi:hypothetical protein